MDAYLMHGDINVAELTFDVHEESVRSTSFTMSTTCLSSLGDGRTRSCSDTSANGGPNVPSLNQEGESTVH